MTHRSWVGKNGELVSQPTLTVEEFRAIVDEAHGWGRKVACHAYSGIGLQRALDGGCDSIEHGLEMTDGQIAQMVQQGTWYCPHAAAVLSRLGARRYARPASATATRSVHELPFEGTEGRVKIAFGTDMGGISWTEPMAQEFPAWSSSA